jgi:uncharacterized membrane protein YvlD (DUF360 family)
VRNAARLIVVWAASTAGFLVADALLGAVHVDGAASAVAAGAVTALLNVLLWPLLIRLALPVTVLTLGLGAILLNGAIVAGVAALLPGVAVDSFGAGVLVALILAVVTTLVTSLLAIEDEERLVRHQLLRAARGHRRKDGADERPPGVIFLEIDGLAHQVLSRALRDGNAPAIAGWLRDGSHRLLRWETDWSSQTGACQAGLLHGNNRDVPAFRWWDKERGARFVTMRPRNARELERRISDGRGLLHADGASRGNLVSGDAPHTLLTSSTVLDAHRRRPIGRDYLAYFASPYNVTRTLVLALADIVAERRAAADQRRRDVRPRIDRTLKLALIRAYTTVVSRDVEVESILADAFEGRPVVYSTFLGYDEVAHLSGIERPDTLAVLRKLDLEFGRIARVVREAPRRYEIVVLSDHGQSQGPAFERQYGVSLDQLVRDAAGIGEPRPQEDEGEALGRVGAGRADPGRSPQNGGAGMPQTAGGNASSPPGDGVPEVVVMASGCLGLISFPRLPGRVTLEQLQERYPRLLPALREHPATGFLLVRSERHGPVVLGPRGVRRLSSGEVDGDDPLAPFGEHAARHVAREDSFANCPDIVVNSRYATESDELAVFEDQVGHHGGLGGPQSFPFMVVPARLPLPDDRVVGAEAAHRMLRGWLAGLGHRAYA